MDAGIMEGCSKRCGAVGAIKKVSNPISVARKVMEKTKHSLICGIAAKKFASQNRVGGGAITIKKEVLAKYHRKLKRLSNDDAFGTVGAVALDKKGNIASAVSTGGMWLKREGRISDSAIVGSGYFADSTGGAVSTGNGDAIMKLGMARFVCDLIAHKKPVQKACKIAVSELRKLEDGSGGIIALNKNGEVGVDYNTRGMPRGYFFNDMGIPEVKIFSK